MKDEAEVSFEVGQREDGKLWTIAVTCPEKLSEQEFAASILSLAQDILEGKVSFETQPDTVETHDSH